MEPGGIEPIIGYLLAKENEIRIIRIIMVGRSITCLPIPYGKACVTCMYKIGVIGDKDSIWASKPWACPSFP